MKYLSKSIYCAIFLIFCSIFFSSGLKALDSETISLDEAMEWGKIHSPTMEKLLTEITTQQNKKNKIAAQLNWQVDLKTTTSYGTVSSINPNPADDLEGDLAISMQGSKSFSSGLSLEPEISFLEKDLADFDNLQDKVNFHLKLQQRLYPIIPNELEEKYYEFERDQTKSELDYQWQGEIKQIDWLESYLELIRLSAKAQLEEKNYHLADDNLKTVLQQEVIGEAGPQQVLTAEIGLQQAEIRMKQSNNKFTRQKESWYQQLGLAPGKKLILTESSAYLQEMIRLVDSFNEDLEDTGLLMEKVLAVHPQLKSNQLDQDLIQLQREWNGKKVRPEVNLNGNYDYQDESWSIGANLSYSLYDGGHNAVVDREFQNQLTLLESNYRQLSLDLSLQLKDYLHQLEIDQLTLKEKKLAVDKLRLETQSARQQLTKGLITQREWEEKDIQREFAEIDLQTAGDQVLISQLRLIQFIGLFE